MKTFTLTLLCSALSLNAALFSFQGGGEALSVGPGTAGFEFDINAQTRVTALGFFDEFGDTVLNNSHQIGLWNVASGALVAQATVTPGASLSGGFFWQNLPSPLIIPNGTYRLAARYSDIDLDLARAIVPGQNVIFHQDASFVNAYISAGTGFEMPTLAVSAVNYGFFGPNMDFTVVPEPETFGWMAAIGLLGFAVLRRMT